MGSFTLWVLARSSLIGLGGARAWKQSFPQERWGEERGSAGIRPNTAAKETTADRSQKSQAQLAARERIRLKGKEAPNTSPPGTGGDVLPGRIHLSDTHGRGPWAPFPQLGFRDSIWFPGMVAKEETSQIPRAMEWSSFNPTPPPGPFLCSKESGSQNNHEHESTYWKPTTCPGECSRLRSSHPSTSSAFLILYASARPCPHPRCSL